MPSVLDLTQLFALGGGVEMIESKRIAVMLSVFLDATARDETALIIERELAGVGFGYPVGRRETEGSSR